MTDLPTSLLASFPQAGFVPHPTPLERLDRLSDHYGLDLWVKRDDLTGIGMGGNKIRQLDFYFGDAMARGADTILITGAVQSNYVRAAAACAARSGMRAIVQLEDRVPGMGETYRQSGNVLLDRLLGAEIMTYAEGEDEAGADAALRGRAAQLRAEGRVPYVIPLGLDNPPLGALGYMRCAEELLAQDSGFDRLIVASGSGATHGGVLAGLRAQGSGMSVHGICVRRKAEIQRPRLIEIEQRISALLGQNRVYSEGDIHVWDGALAPGYGRIGPRTRRALDTMARQAGLFLDPVYTAKAFAGVEGLLEEGVITKGDRLCFLHTGGLPALFAYEPEFRA